MSSIPMPPVELRQALLSKNAARPFKGKTKFSSGVIPEVFETQVRTTPERIAVMSGGEQITYAKLNERANRLAHYLRKRGVTAETMVGIYLDRNLHALTAIIAILKAGGAYVPIDPIYPPDRIEFILQDAKIDILLTESRLIESLPKREGSTVALDAEWASISQEPGHNLARAAAPSNAAYVIYTSGSTGKPKGVIVTHHNVVRLFSATDDFFKFSQADVWTLFHSFTFDLSVWEMWGAFFYGGKLVVVPYLTSRSPEAFYELLSREHATVLTQTPSAFRQLIWADESAPKKLELDLRFVVLAGEALELQSLRPWFDRRSDARPAIINMYGITETTVHVTQRRITSSDLTAGMGSVIGEPMSDLTLHILDEQQRPCPAGVVGEIYVGGPGVARGYLNRPELNAKRFIPNHLTNIPGERLYRSGDLAVRLESGEVEFLGRMDDQIKIRGFRVELGEIQSALQEHPGIRENVIVAQTQKDQGTRLVAYYVPRQEGLTVDDLRSFLGKTLPDYMIPAVFMRLDNIPLTLNGKVDRRALPSPDHSRPNLMTKLVLPTTPNEKILAAIWRDVLQVNEVGIHDNFFALGGDSIRSIQVLAQAHHHGLKLSLNTLFAEPTIYELARHDGETGEETGAGNPLPFALVTASDSAKMPAGIVDAYPMAKLQLGMVFHSGFAPGSAVFHDVFSYRSDFEFDGPKFQSALERLIERHAIFRTSFDLANYSEPLQLVHEKVSPKFSIEDLKEMPAAAQEKRILSWIETEKRNPFDWNCPPFARFHVQIRSSSSFQLFVSFHHSVMDGWSLARTVTELMQEYVALLQNRPATIKPPAVTYRDFVSLEREAIHSAKTREYWKTKLENIPDTKLPRWPASSRKAGTEQVRSPRLLIKDQQLQSLKDLARSAGVPLKAVLLAAHCRVISLLAAQTEIVTGLIANGRPQAADGERLIGVFLNAVPFRIAMSGGTWKDLVKQTFVLEKELIPHRRFPLAETRQMGEGRPALESAFDYVQFHTLLDVPGFNNGKFAEDHYFEANDFNLYATFMLNANSSELEVHFDYNPNEFSAEQVPLMCEYYSNVLQAIAADPEAKYDEANLLSAGEFNQLALEWNKTVQPVPRTCVHSLVEAQAERTPDRIAAVYRDQKLTYRELDERANALAAELQARGTKPGTIVGICVERSLEMIVSVLAVLKSGGAYLPLDPAYPLERISLMLDDSKSRLVLTQRRLFHLFDSSERELIPVDESTAVRPASFQTTPERSSVARPEDLAYLIYTSGSTGRPKGVEIPHAAVVNFLFSMKAQPGLRPHDRLLAVTTLSFDIAGLEIFLPLITGASVVIAESETLLSPAALAAMLDEEEISVMQATPTVWRNLVESGWTGKRSLKALCGGEKLSSELAIKLSALCGEVWNMYGPTETTIWSTIHKVEGYFDPVPIGRPIANTEVFILNDRLLPVPTGAEGEIYIGGIGLARGYHGQPELTQERFVPHPFQNGKRLYRTGDLGRYLPDGTILISGRVDHQVKLHGHRIELGEIEAALQQHPNVSAAIVALRADPTGEPRLVAYWTPRSGDPDTSTKLRSFLEERLPRYMVPSVFQQIEKLPLTPNGKVDRKNLPEPELESLGSEQTLITPRTPLEEIVAETWKEVLKVARVGIRDDFFELGGDSLRAAQVVSKLRAQLDVGISFASIFQNRTIESLALCVMDQMLRTRENGSVEQTLPDSRESLIFNTQRA